jgi:hypothetical protein
MWRRQGTLLQERAALSWPRAPKTTVGFVEQDCALYQEVFPEVRSCEQGKFLPLGLLAELPRKPLPAITRGVG